jgi:hypothetical protein
MIQIGVATVRFHYQRVDDQEFRQLGVSLFDVANSEATTLLSMQGAQVVLELEEGTLRVRTRLLVTATGLAAFLSSYGSIRQGAEYLAKDVMRAASAIISRVTDRAGIPPQAVIRSRRSATLTWRLRHILGQLERGEVTADETTKRIVHLLDPDAEDAIPESLIARIASEVGDVPRSAPDRRAFEVQETMPLTVVEWYADEPGPATVLSTTRKEHPLPGRRLRIYMENVGGRPRLRIEQ